MEPQNSPDWAYIHMTVALTFDWMEANGIRDRMIDCLGFQLRLAYVPDRELPDHPRRIVYQMNGPNTR